MEREKIGRKIYTYINREKGRERGERGGTHGGMALILYMTGTH